ncbi:SAM-dependent methyltransferase [Streptomyces sp. NPDC048258]|uniref:SAM-dependent methyltransferase n=1 Tax=Streptomyces sp. NPDC048258 TaxID=3365527 RepID=UPI003714DD7D
MEIEILVVPDCPHSEPAAELLRQALDDVGLHGATVTTRVVTGQGEAEERGFTGSPTFLIDGRDPFAEAGRPAGLACRVYQTPAGLSGLPGLGQLRQALTGRLHDQDLADAQRRHWQNTYFAHPGMYGEQPSTPAVHAAAVLGAAGANDVLELGSGHGRDALYFAREGFTVQATDFSSAGLQQLQEAARIQGVADRVSTAVHGTPHGDDIYEHGGFAVHFFSRDLVEALSDGWTLNEVHGFEEGELPRRLWRVTQTRPL